MSEVELLLQTVKSFRLLELQNLMLFAGKSKLGKKSELLVSGVCILNYLKYITYWKTSTFVQFFANFLGYDAYKQDCPFLRVTDYFIR